MTTSDIDLNFRPSSYFWPLGLASHLLATVKGAERRAMLQPLIDSDRLDRTLPARQQLLGAVEVAEGLVSCNE
jgi:hypothetical protein